MMTNKDKLIEQITNCYGVKDADEPLVVFENRIITIAVEETTKQILKELEGCFYGYDEGCNCENTYVVDEVINKLKEIKAKHCGGNENE